ncbi:MAG: DNA/RNA non-specific endonuclease [Sulfuricurvum sp.]|jgi:endonuclease G|uniref:DNA/RNA non-specific endonuclease n=1 Tax=Sulfuricurvum sp. TaxID=2025608 RepID=UPI0025E34B6F|nr:DNA/RNA non-specific endonuclease [Sulfuricurvum sp.]MCK9372710.1 DNA/RNA non-specific endonuclease [Sulfuricurvum sp.]
MKLFLLPIASLLLSTALFSAPTQCSGLYYGDEAPDILNTKLLPKTKELCYSSFALMHSGISRTPLWSAEHLTQQGLRHKSKRTNDFHPDDQLNADERAELSDYARSGYDRGHMAPSADMGTKQSQHECFTLANMIPQNGENNRGIWSAIESATRHLTNQKGELYVITGPIFSGSQVKRIGGRVLVPTKLYKAIYDPSSGRGAAYLVSNAPTGDYEVVSIFELEQISGLKLFPKMTPSAKQKAMDLPDPQERHGSSYNNLTNKDIIHLLETLLKWIF